MIVTLEQAIEIHAKSALYRDGKAAIKQTLELAERYRQRGDITSFETWKQVSQKISELEAENGQPLRRRA